MDIPSTPDIQSTADDIFSTYGLDDFEEFPIVPFIGLRNLGNSCFFNSVLQILFYCPGFQKCLTEIAEKIKDGSIECSGNAVDNDDNLKLLLELQKLFIHMRNNQDVLLNSSDEIIDKENIKAVRPEDLMQILRKVYPAFEPYTQQDAQECLRCILSILQDAMQPLDGENKSENLSKPMITDKTCKVFGGRKFGDTVVVSSTNEKSQRENQDPNINPIKQVSRTTASRKKHMKTFLRRPLKVKSNSEEPVQHFGGKSPTNVEYKLKTNTKLIRNEHSLTENENSVNVKSSGCFGKLTKRHVTSDNIVQKSSSSLISTPTKRPNSCDITSLSPPTKRKKLNIGNGIKSFCKPFSSNLNKSKLPWQTDKNKSYSLVESNKSGKRNPFKVILKSSQNSQYKKFDTEDAKINGFEDEFLEPEDLIANVKDQLVNEKDIDEEEIKKPLKFVENLFQGLLVNEIRCMECENSVQRKEPFMDISLPVRESRKALAFTAESNKEELSESSSDDEDEELTDNCSVMWGLSAFTCHEILEGENKYYCDKCCRYSEGERKLQFSSLPPILTFHLKRFATSKPHAGGDAFCGTVSKINSCLSVPLQLCLHQWCSSSCGRSKEKYILFGIIIHSGVTISSGHYLSYVRLMNSSLSRGKEDMDERLQTYEDSWLEADDERTRIITQKELLDVISPTDVEGISRTPYLLFYHRVDDI
uniref:ubiquitin carboxyl-terminal hydrolase 1-like n=1 Tax=Styela clava TaxID=7725 RepID=UPI00193A07ED|nr:ubiquitin carboxyl-terminal hydrolase 1-like [Styela clava]